MACKFSNELWAFIAVDEDGHENVIAYPFGSGIRMPLIAPDETRLRQLEPFAQRIATVRGVKVRLLKFTSVEELRVIKPE